MADQGYRRGHGVGTAWSRWPAGHYFDPDPAVALRGRRHGAPRAARRDARRSRTDRGVFSADRVDPGTKQLLLEAARRPPRAAHLLDLGCGYGPIALTLARRAPDADGVGGRREPSGRSTSAAANAARLGVATSVHVRSPDDVPDDLRFDGDLVEPADPHRQGRAARPARTLARPLARRRRGGARGAEAPRRRLAAALARRRGMGRRAARARAPGYRLLEVGTR